MFSIGIFLLFLLGLYLRLISVRSEAAKSIEGDVAKPVKVINPEPTETWFYREVLGRVEGGQEIDLKADVGGWVENIYFKSTINSIINLKNHFENHFHIKKFVFGNHQYLLSEKYRM